MLQSIVTFFTQSSEDPTKTSATLTGMLIMAASWAQMHLTFIPFVAAFFASPLGHEVQPIATELGYAVGSILFFFGLFRKLTNKLETTVTTPA